MRMGGRNEGRCWSWEAEWQRCWKHSSVLTESFLSAADAAAAAGGGSDDDEDGRVIT